MSKRVKAEQDPNVDLEPPFSPNDAQPGGSDDEGSPTIPERVAGLAMQLNFGCPRYQIDPDGDMPNMWKGRPYFQQDALVPEDLGIVRGIYGKKQAKLEIAAKVLVWLKAQDRARQETTARLLATLGPIARQD